MATQGLRPARIRNSMPRKFQVAIEGLPELKVVQNVSNYFRKTYVMNNDFVDEIADYIHTFEFNGSEADSSAFTFSWRNDDNGHIDVGIGSDEKPFVVGVTSKKLLSRLDRPVDSFVFHVNATFKVTQVEYPVLGLETQYTDMLNALRLMYFRIMQKSLTVYYVMGDAEDAQYKAIQNTFGSDNTIRILIYYFHVISNVLKRTKSMEPYFASKVVRDIYTCTLVEVRKNAQHLVKHDSAEKITCNESVC
ncbi:hypothetical protein PHMEG_00033902 [Phytophthora megakarya]|uniref:MULE transposase domain-containing protein n=1 Tax=Phytophthora megakarya TaxID=4795 RepID=A0A225US91_9STRA|nr:hypothetical protein PHMEG_00033902 [Phytophthora megakarya]